jgi:hypothetical protein
VAQNSAHAHKTAHKTTHNTDDLLWRNTTITGIHGKILTNWNFLSETSMGEIPFGSVTEMRYGSDVVALFLSG